MKSGARSLFGLAALLLSFITGIATGNNPLYALVKSLVLTVVFAGIGYGAVIILRRFVPELVEILDSPGKIGEVDEGDAPGHEPEADASGDSGGDGERKPDTVLEKEFEPLKSGDLKHFSGVDGVKEGSMGKHYMKEEKKVKYEPTIIAAAIRTMMSRDKE